MAQAAVPYPDILDVSGIGNRDTGTYGTCRGRHRSHIFTDNLPQSGHKLRSVPVQGHHIGLLRGQAVIYHDLTAPCLVEYRHFHPVAE